MQIMDARFPAALLSQAAWEFQVNMLDGEAQRWKTLDRQRQSVTRRVFVPFHAGEEIVATSIAPLGRALRCIGADAAADLIERQRLDEIQHDRFFTAYGQEVPLKGLREARPAATSNLTSIRRELEALDSQGGNPTAVQMLRSVLIYHIVTEGVIASAGYRCLLAAKCIPHLSSLQQGFRRINQDEARHVRTGQRVLWELRNFFGAPAALAETAAGYLDEQAEVIDQSVLLYFPKNPGDLQECREQLRAAARVALTHRREQVLSILLNT